MTPPPSTPAATGFDNPDEHVVTTVGDLLGGGVEEGEGLALCRAPLHIWSRPLTQGGREHAALIAESLGRRGLMDFLASIAPYKGRGRDDFSGVLDDWYLHDRAATSAPSEKLLHDHSASLLDHWQEFTRHRRLLIDIMEDRQETVRLAPLLRWRSLPGARREWSFEPLDAASAQAISFQAGLGDEAAGNPALSTLAGFLSVFYFLPELKHAWPEWKSLAEEGKSNYMGPAQVSVLALLHRDIALTSRLVQSCEQGVTSNE